MKSLNQFSTRLKLTLGALLCLSAFLLLADGEVLQAVRHAIIQAAGQVAGQAAVSSKAPRPVAAAHRALPAVALQTGSGFTLPQTVLAGGGGESSGGTFQEQGTTGQSLTGVSSGGQFSVASGFWPGAPAGAPCPAIALSPATLPNPFIGQPYSQTITASGGAAPYTFAANGALPPGITLGTGGLLSGTTSQYSAYNFGVTATDANGCTGTQSYSFDIVCPALAIGPPVLPAGTIGASYGAQLSLSGGTGPYTFLVMAGALPTGVTLTMAGALSGVPSAAGTFLFTVRALDVFECETTRDYAITITCPSITVNPPTLPNKTVGEVVTGLSVSATGGNAPYAFAITGGALPAGLMLASNGAITGTVTATPGPYSFTITATDARGCTGARFYSITVNPAACPLITVSPNSPLNATVGAAYSQMLNGSGGTMPYTFSLTNGSLPPGVLLSNAGLLSGTPTTLGTYTFTVTATDANTCQGSTAYTFFVNCPTITVEPAALPNKTVGQVVTTLSVSATGGLAPYTFAVTSGALPTGLTLAPNGSITGTVTAAPGPFSFTITATDARGCTGARFYAITVNPLVCPVINVTPTTLPAATVGVAYSQTIGATGGTAPYSFSVSQGNLPAGLSLANGGLLSGTPTVTGSFNFTITATAANGCQGSTAYSFVVNCPTITVNPATLPDKTVGQVVATLSVSAAGGLAPYSFALTSGALPTGLSLAANGSITGTVIAMPGPFSFTITTTDARGCTGSRFYSMTVNPVVCPTITVTPATLPAATVSAAYSQTLTASGGTAPYSFSVSNGILPPGLSLAANGQLTGMPTATGALNFTITATDANNCQSSTGYGFAVNCPIITVNPFALPAGAFGAAYNQTLTASGGSGNYSFSLSGGVLPAGLNLSGAGALTGTPGELGSFTFTVRATNGNNCAGERQYTLAIGCGTVTVNPASLPGGTTGTAYNQTITATPGGGGYSFAVTSGVLPLGLSLNAGNGAITGTPVSRGTFTFTITATAQGNCAGSRTYTVTVGCAAITLTTLPLPDVTAGISYSHTLTVTPAGNYTFNLVQGNLPSGLTLSLSGVLSGLALVVNGYNFAIRASDSNGCQGTQAYSLAVVCPTISLSALPTATLNTFYNQTVTATPATGNYSFAVTSGGLPPGLALNGGTGSLSGTPTALGTYNFTLTATGFGICTGSRAYSFTTGSGCPTVTLADLPAGAPGQLYNNSVTASPSGGYGYAVASGSLPPGLTLYGSAGLVNGYPTTAGTYNFTISAIDGNNCTGQRSYSVTIGSGTAAPARAVAGDFDGDGKTDFALWRGAQSAWLILNSSRSASQRESLGAAPEPQKDLIVPGDYDGDGKIDAAIYRMGAPDGCHWLIKRSSDGRTSDKLWGLATDIPVPADYDGDGKIDIAVWRGGDTRWYIVRSSDEKVQTIAWGTSLAPYFDVPVPADYDGDGKTDAAVFRKSTGYWYIKRSSDGATVVNRWGLGTDVPVPADYDGDGKADIAVWRGSDTNWYVVQSSDDTVQVTPWGSDALGDVPVPGDYDGDGKADIAVWRPAEGAWYVRRSSDGAVLVRVHGQQGDTPVCGKHN